ncbi:MAG: serine/threonine protein kinase, partial [Proteobacteria bacterium]|nr:serine/threonine protein kinase [Pseudomonadota bacterium]
MASTTQHIARRYRETSVITDNGLTVLVQTHDETLDTPATVEHLKADAGAAHEQSDLAQAFIRAGHHVKRIDHPNVARVLDVIEDADPALVFERLEAQTLEDHVNASPHLIEPDVAVRWASAICDALACLHGHSPPLMHLDLKPSNLLLTRGGRLVLTGFGLLREADGSAAPVALLSGAGTPGYAAPEQLESSSIDARADLYGLGATLYAALTRRTPPDARDLRDGRARWEPPEMHNPQVSPALSQAIRVLMSASRDARPNTAEEARELLSPRREIAATPRPTGTDDAGDAA